VTKPVESPKKSPRRPSLELQTMHKIDVLLCELEEAARRRVLDRLMSIHHQASKIGTPANPLSDIEGD
jgi:hypothetical protein